MSPKSVIQLRKKRKILKWKVQITQLLSNYYSIILHAISLIAIWFVNTYLSHEVI